MKWFYSTILAVALCAPVSASSLDFSLSPIMESGQPTTYPLTVDFIGTLTDTDTSDLCDNTFTNCLYLNGISFSFDSSTAMSHLSGDSDPFYSLGATSPGAILSDDSTGSGLYYTETGPVFGITIAPDTPIGYYTGSVTILGGIDSQTAMDPLATATFAIDVVPEPAAGALAFFGLAGLLAWRRRAHS